MIFGDIIALIGMAISVLMFVYLGLQDSSKAISIEQVLLANRSASSTQFGASFAAASTSLATVIIFFISYSSFFGISLLWCGGTYLVGQVIFLRFMKGVNIDTSSLTTNADFVFHHMDLKRTAQIIAIMTASSFILILFLELYIGSEIISYYLTGMGTVGKAISYFSLGAIVIIYVRLGGLKVVFRTDVWQLSVMIVACIALLLFAFLYSPIPSVKSSPTSPPFFATATNSQLLVFMLWILILNFTLPFTQLSSWQRLAATKSIDEAWSGLRRSAPSFLVIWMIPVFALVILNSKGVTPGSLSDLFDVLRSSGSGYSNILYPLIFVGFASALFSTADTALVALQFSLSDSATFGNRLRAMDEVQLRRVLTFSTFLIIAALSLIYGMAVVDLGSWFIPLVYTIFSQLSVVAPQVVYSMLEASGKIQDRKFGKLSDKVNMTFMLLAWSILILATIGRVNEILPASNTQEIATYISVAVSSLGLFLAYLLAEKTEGGV